MKPESYLCFVFCCLSSLLAARVLAADCVWYDECGLNPDTSKPVNCYYNGTAKPFQNAATLPIFQKLCPDLYQGPTTATCCSDRQMMTLLTNLDVPQQLLGGCPTCLHNFLNIYCYLTCHPHNADFLYPKVLSPWTDPTTHRRQQQVLEIDYALTASFAGGMFNSCKEVPSPTGVDPAIGILCGHAADECTPQNWLDYMGNTGNQQTPFSINFNITANSFINAQGYHVTPANASITPSPCTSGPSSAQTASTRSPSDHSLYRQEQIIIRRTGHHPDVIHQLAPPSVTTMNFTSIFDKEFLHQVLDLQRQVEAITATHGGASVGLRDICQTSWLPGNDECVFFSILGYYRDNATALDRVVLDEWGFYVIADYLDHFLQCAINPKTTVDTTALHDSCLGRYGGAVYPYDVLEGYQGPQGTRPFIDDAVAGCCKVERIKYETSTRLKLTWLVQNHQDSGATQAWETAFKQFLTNYSQHQPDMTLSWHTGLASGDQVLLPVMEFHVV